MLPVDTAMTEVRGIRNRLHELLQQLQATSKTYLVSDIFLYDIYQLATHVI